MQRSSGDRMRAGRGVRRRMRVGNDATAPGFVRGGRASFEIRRSDETRIRRRTRHPGARRAIGSWAGGGGPPVNPAGSPDRAG
ncbi:hypothetical protein FRUB_10196 [Fimbriiglobus ruber]|uniref:Uncharacterized protein n=1 Tax=Fimbriiglobus ruber TaxID=1908690 RepID=A0A225DCU9_9BACT|nr:hypothetical protein FRUB_10196 [Fimbriiglobus ruber]